MADVELVNVSSAVELVSSTSSVQVSISTREAVVLEVMSVGLTGPMGPRGLAGASGAGTTASVYLAGSAIGGLRVVLLASDQRVIYADQTIVEHARRVLGVSLNAAIENDEVTICTGGEVTDPSWNWDTDLPVYLGINGLLTQVAPAIGFSLVIGIALSSTYIFVNIREPIILV